MKVAVVGSRSVKINNFNEYLPRDTCLIISGGAKGVDECVRKYAIKNNIQFIEILPDYKRYGKGAPLRRNAEIVKYADLVLAFWDGKIKRNQKFN